MCSIFSVFVIFTILMMIIAYISEENRALTIGSNNNNTIEQPSISTNDSTSNAFNTGSEAIVNPPDVVMDCSKTTVEQKTFTDAVVQCFSVRQNLKTLTSVKTSPNAVPALDGLKYVSIFFTPSKYR